MRSHKLISWKHLAQLHGTARNSVTYVERMHTAESRNKCANMQIPVSLSSVFMACNRKQKQLGENEILGNGSFCRFLNLRFKNIQFSINSAFLFKTHAANTFKQIFHVAIQIKFNFNFDLFLFLIPFSFNSN